MTSRPSLSSRARPLERFQPTSGLALGYAGVAAAVVALGYSVWAVHTVTGLRIGLGAVFFGLVVWVTQLRPRAAAYEGHVVLKNSLRDAHVPYREVDEVALGQTLNLWVGEQRYVCIGIGSSFREELRSKRRARQTSGMSRLGELTLRADRANSDERAISYQTFVVTRLEELVDQAKRARVPPEAPEAGHRVAWPEVAALVLSGLAFTVSLFL